MIKGSHHKRRAEAAPQSDSSIANQIRSKSQVTTCGRAKKWMLEAAIARARNGSVINRKAPRRTAKWSANANTAAIIKAAKNATAFSPAQECRGATTRSKQYSQAYHVWPCIVAEKGSVRVIACVCRISSPLRMCQPIPASPRSRDESQVPLSAMSNSRNTRSPAEGSRYRSRVVDRIASAEGCVLASGKSFENTAQQSYPNGTGLVLRRFTATADSPCPPACGEAENLRRWRREPIPSRRVSGQLGQAYGNDETVRKRECQPEASRS